MIKKAIAETFAIRKDEKLIKCLSSKNFKLLCNIIGVSVIIIAALFLLYPIVLLSFRNAPNCDDFTYGQLTHFSYLYGDSIWKLLLYTWITVKDTFLMWQGTYSAVFLFAVHPGIFGDEWYFITTFVLLISILVPPLYLHICYGKRRTLSFIGTIICFMFMVMYCPSPAQGIYWWNGAIYYTFFWSATAVLMICLLKNRRNISAAKTILYILGAIFIVGGNFIVALGFVATLFLLIVYDLYETRRFNLQFSLILLFAICGLLVSCLAPGNAYRQALNDQQSITFSVYWSARLAVRHFIYYFDRKFFGLLLIVTPMFMSHGSSASKKVDVKPFLYFAFCSVSFFVILFFPWVYATGMISYIPERILNIIFYTFVSLTIVNTVWLANLLVNKCNHSFLIATKALAVIVGVIILFCNIDFSDTTTARALHGLQQESNDTVDVFMHYETEWVLKVMFEGEDRQVPFPTYRVGAVTYVDIEQMSQYLEKQYSLDSFSLHYEFFGDTFVRLREACELFDIGISYSDDNGGIAVLILPDADNKINDEEIE